MFIDQINLNQLRIFESVYRTRSMTKASHELSLTQSGVSQHMKSLEGSLGFHLFDRMNRKLIPTARAKSLFEIVDSRLKDLESRLTDLKSGRKELRGHVSIGMPIEFGNSFIAPLISKFGQKHPYVEFQFQLGHASEMNEQLLSGELDMAFVDAYQMDRRIKMEPVFREMLQLCISKDLLKAFGSPKNESKYFEKLPYVAYRPGEPMLRMWMKHHLKANLDLNVRARIMDVQGMRILVESGLGAGILPDYLATRLAKQGRRLHIFKGCGSPVQNKISVAYLKDRSQSAAVTELVSFVRSEFA